MRWHSRGGRSLFLAKIVTPSRVAGPRATRVSQPIAAASRRDRDLVKGVAALVIRRGSGYGPASHAFRTLSASDRVVILRLLLALWAAAIYAIYWYGYLRGAL